MGHMLPEQSSAGGAAAMVGYFDELERAASLSEPLDDASLVAMAARYNMQVLGPVPEGYS